MTLENTIVAQNPGPVGNEQNLSGSIASNDFNLIGDADNGTLTGLTINTIFAADALLLPLAGNGGPTQTHLPGSGSPAIGLGSTDLMVDQRDVTRPQGSQDDIGAVEVDLNGFVIDANLLGFGNAGDGNGDEFLIINDPTGITGEVLVYVNSQLVFAEPQATTGLILIRGSADDDTLIVDNSNGLIGANIIFDGDGLGAIGPDAFPVFGGFDTLRLIGSTPTDTTYNPGQTADAGAIFQTDNQVTQRVQFFGLEPIQVLAPVAGNNILNVAAAPLGVGFPQALNASNSINYIEGPNSNDPVDPVFVGAVTGLITVDGFESLEFANFEVLNIDAGAGSDEINLNHPGRPNELNDVNVSGGDPTAGSDVVVFNGSGVSETISVDQLTIDGAQIVTDANPNVTYVVGTAESLILNGQGGGDIVSVTTPAGSDEITLSPGATIDAASIDIRDFNAVSLLPIRYEDIGDAGSLTLASASDGEDVLFINGTDFADAFAVAANGDITVQRPDLGFTVSTYVPISTAGVGQVSLRGYQGDDSFDIVGNHPFGGFGGPGVLIQGGTPDSGSDVLNFVGSGAGAVTIDLDAQTITEVGFADVSYAGVETVNVDANNTLTVDGTAGNDHINVTPINADNDGSFENSGSPGVDFHYSDATTITFNGGAGVDQLNVLGDAVADIVTAAGSAIIVDGSTVTLGTGLEAAGVIGFAGDDNIDLSALTFATGITIRGGDGNDTIVGSPQDDLSFGGAGNDILVGGMGSDTQYGEDGNDIFGNPTLAADGTADDPGTDFNFGGNGFDNFVWEPGDGTDFNNGGDDGADIFRFFGGAAGDTFVLRPGGTPTHFNAVFNGAVIDNHGIEDVLVDPMAGDDTVAINDLFTTEVVNVSIIAGGGNETISVAGRSTADDIQVTSPNQSVEIEGLTYDVNISDSDTSDNLTINANEGNDSVSVAAGVEILITSTVNGGAGNDALSARSIRPTEAPATTPSSAI